MKKLPTAFQRNVMWTALTALSITLIGALAIGFIYLGTRVIAFLQPILMPFAVAGVLAYLLDPAVRWLGHKGIKRQRAVLLVFAVFSLLLAGLVWWIAPKIGQQTANLARKVPGYTAKARTAIVGYAQKLETDYDIKLLPQVTKETPDAAQPGAVVVQTVTPAEAAPAAVAADYDVQTLLSGDWVQTTLPTVLKNIWNFIKSSVGGFLGIFGFLLSLIIVPLYLYYFLLESATIKAKWASYLPLRASAFKDELVACLTEINRYLIAFFRGQLFVSLINGVATGIGLMIIGLDFGLLIGLALCVLGIIPYLGIVLCWIPAIIIGSVQGGSALIPGDPWWAMPLAVTGIFLVVQQIDALFITPRIVGEAVGLHPVTVIASVLMWSLLLGGLLGAILAVPLTASVKVLFQRYIWHARIAPRHRPAPAPAERALTS
jgi:predicted PurR-regulated permease PerM